MEAEENLYRHQDSRSRNASCHAVLVEGTKLTSLADHEIEFPCSKCGFYNPATLRQVISGDVVICRGCKSSVQLDDHLNSIRRTVGETDALMQDLIGTIRRLPR